MQRRPGGEMDITADFGSAILGSSPGRGTRAWYSAKTCGYGLVVERVLAKDETGVRFSLAAPKEKCKNAGIPAFLRYGQQGTTLGICG